MPLNNSSVPGLLVLFMFVTGVFAVYLALLLVGLDPKASALPSRLASEQHLLEAGCEEKGMAMSCWDLGSLAGLKLRGRIHSRYITFEGFVPDGLISCSNLALVKSARFQRCTIAYSHMAKLCDKIECDEEFVEGSGESGLDLGRHVVGWTVGRADNIGAVFSSTSTPTETTHSTIPITKTTIHPSIHRGKAVEGSGVAEAPGATKISVLTTSTPTRPEPTTTTAPTTGGSTEAEEGTSGQPKISALSTAFSTQSSPTKTSNTITTSTPTTPYNTTQSSSATTRSSTWDEVSTARFPPPIPPPDGDEEEEEAPDDPPPPTTVLPTTAGVNATDVSNITAVSNSTAPLPVPIRAGGIGWEWAVGGAVLGLVSFLLIGCIAYRLGKRAGGGVVGRGEMRGCGRDLTEERREERGDLHRIQASFRQYQRQPLHAVCGGGADGAEVGVPFDTLVTIHPPGEELGDLETSFASRGSQTSSHSHDSLFDRVELVDKLKFFLENVIPFLVTLEPI